MLIYTNCVAYIRVSSLIHALCRYPQYVVHCDAQSSLLATNESYTRYSTESLYGVTFDVLTLSQCDYLVCTFSSQVVQHGSMERIALIYLY